MSGDKLPIWIVVAMAENNVIGRDGDMPWKLSTDLQHFKSVTMGKPMIMGRKTFEAIGKPLPGRTSIVVTRDKSWQSPGVVPAQSLDQALSLAAEIAKASEANAICIVGGGQIYAQAMDHADRLHVTRVHAAPEGDTVFPDIDERQWEEVSSREVPAGEKDSAATTFVEFRRRD
ncbi:MAG: dihydrofolate reductase [Pseudomonadota bacterium]